MVAVPEVGGNIPVKIDLGRRDIERTISRVEHFVPWLHKHLVYVFLCVRMHLCDIHGGGLPSPILSQKGSNLALIKADAKSIHCWRRVTTEHLDQVLNTNTLHQVSWLCFKE